MNQKLAVETVYHTFIFSKEDADEMVEEMGRASSDIYLFICHCYMYTDTYWESNFEWEKKERKKERKKEIMLWFYIVCNHSKNQPTGKGSNRKEILKFQCTSYLNFVYRLDLTSQQIPKLQQDLEIWIKQATKELRKQNWC